jgi:multicomponent Na+:H+ antiporter subunit E
MGRHTIFTMLTLTFVWIILVEEFSWRNVATGMFMSMICMHFIGRFLQFKEIRNISFYKLAAYPFWLVQRIYVDAAFVIKMILTDSKVGFMEQKLNLDNESLRIILADSITLTPGSVFLELEGETITLLCIGDKASEGFPAAMEGLHRIENFLVKSQRQEQPAESNLI